MIVNGVPGIFTGTVQRDSQAVKKYVCHGWPLKIKPNVLKQTAKFRQHFVFN